MSENRENIGSELQSQSQLQSNSRLQSQSRSQSQSQSQSQSESESQLQSDSNVKVRERFGLSPSELSPVSFYADQYKGDLWCTREACASGVCWSSFLSFFGRCWSKSRLQRILIGVGVSVVVIVFVIAFGWLLSSRSDAQLSTNDSDSDNDSEIEHFLNNTVSSTGGTVDYDDHSDSIFNTSFPSFYCSIFHRCVLPR